MAALLLPSVFGCAAVGESIFEGVFNSIFDDDVEIDPRILKRKGIEPGSKQHQRMLAKERAYKELQRDFYRDDGPGEISITHQE